MGWYTGKSREGKGTFSALPKKAIGHNKNIHLLFSDYFPLYIKSNTPPEIILYKITTEWLADKSGWGILGTMQVLTRQKPVEIERKGISRFPMAFCICKDLGIDCSYEATGTTDNEVMRKFIDHAESAHNMHLLTADVIYRVQKVIKK